MGNFVFIENISQLPLKNHFTFFYDMSFLNIVSCMATNKAILVTDTVTRYRKEGTETLNIDKRVPTKLRPKIDEKKYIINLEVISQQIKFIIY